MARRKTRGKSKKLSKKSTKKIFLGLGLLVIIVLIFLFIGTIRNSLISMKIKSIHSEEKIISYCEKKNYACYFTYINDASINKTTASRVVFLKDNKFTEEPKQAKVEPSPNTLFGNNKRVMMKDAPRDKEDIFDTLGIKAWDKDSKDISSQVKISKIINAKTGEETTYSPKKQASYNITFQIGDGDDQKEITKNLTVTGNKNIYITLQLKPEKENE